MLDSGAVPCVSEFADVETAYRALASTGTIYPLVQDRAEMALRAECVEYLESRYTGEAGIRMSASMGWVIAERSR